MGFAVRAVLAVTCAVVLGTRVYGHFEPIRLKLVRSSADLAPAPEHRIAFSASPALTRSAAALILRVRNDDAAPARIVVGMNGMHLASATVPPRSARRIDVQAVHLPERGELQVAGLRDRAALEYVELANVHGHTRGVVQLVIVPRAARADWRLPAPLALLVALVLMLAPVGRTRAPGRWRWLVQAARGPALLLIVIALVTPWVSRYWILLSWRTYLFLVLLLYAPTLLGAADSVRAGIARLSAPNRRRVQSTLAIAAVAVFYGAAMTRMLSGHQGRIAWFLHVSDERASSSLLLASRPDLQAQVQSGPGRGYDGQFAYLMAFDPWLRRDLRSAAEYERDFDAAPYRYGRIGFSALTAAVSLGDPARYPGVMLGIVLVSLVLGAASLAGLAAHYGAPPWIVLLYPLVPGFMQSLRFALPEPLAAALLLAGCWALVKSRVAIAVGCFAMSLLVRETGLILIAALTAVYGIRGERHRAAALLASLLPWTSWKVYVACRLYPVFGADAILFNPGDLTWPFTGFVDLWLAVARGTYVSWLIIPGITYPLLLATAFALATALLIARPADAFRIAAFAYGLLAVSLGYGMIWASMPNGERTTYEVFVLLLVALAAFGRQPARLRRHLIGFWCAVAVYDFAFSELSTEFMAGLILFD